MKSLQFITHYTERYSYLDSARMALEGGCRWIQLRMKDAGKEELLEVMDGYSFAKPHEKSERLLFAARLK